MSIGQIVMKLKLDMPCHLSNVYAKFQIDSSKHIEESTEKLGWKDEWMDGQTDQWTLPQHNATVFQMSI